MPVYSERYGRLIGFDTDGEEWARTCPLPIAMCGERPRRGGRAGRVDRLFTTAATCERGPRSVEYPK